MNIWEDVYSKHKEGKKLPVNPFDDQNKPLTDSLDQPTAASGGCSFEELYYRMGKPVPQPTPQPTPPPRPEPTIAPPPPQPVSQPQPQPQQPVSQPHPQPPPQPANLGAGTQAAQPSAPTPPPPKRPVTHYIPRIPSGKLTFPYPPLLARMNYSLSDSWANILVETKQTVETLLVCGAARKEGATFFSYHLAMFLSKEFSMKVLYVDTNLNHTVIPKIQNLPGLYSFVSERKDLASLVVQTEYPGLYMLPSGAGKIAKYVTSNSLTREPIETLLDFSRNNFAVTIIDGQPLTSSPIMIEFARAVDMTLLVCRYGFSRHEVSRSAIDKLQKFGVTSIGVILNDRKFPVPRQVYQLLG